MNVIADTWRGLVRRRLWPLAVLLVAALAALPFLLAKSPAPAAATAPPVAQAAKKTDDTSSFVTLATAPADGKAKRRRVLGAPKDPFQPAPQPKEKKAKKAAATPTPTPAASAAPKSGGATPPPAPPASPTPTPGPTVPKNSLEVRFGLADADTQPLHTLQRLEPLESNGEPVLVYEGLGDHGVAIFSIPGTVTAQGDGTCKPSLDDCQRLELKTGDTEFITVTGTGDPSTDAQFQVELVKIYKKATPVSSTGAAPTTP